MLPAQRGGYLDDDAVPSLWMNSGRSTHSPPQLERICDAWYSAWANLTVGGGWRSHATLHRENISAEQRERQRHLCALVDIACTNFRATEATANETSILDIIGKGPLPYNEPLPERHFRLVRLTDRGGSDLIELRLFDV